MISLNLCYGGCPIRGNTWVPGFTPGFVVVSTLFIVLVFCGVFLFCWSSFYVLCPMLAVTELLSIPKCPSVLSNIYVQK
jgi:hypothetical protein